jgi:hypothetical protein
MKSLADLIRLQKYTTSGVGYEKGDLKGIKELERNITPVVIKNLSQFVPKEKKGFGSKLPELPKLPKLPSLPTLPKLPKL